MGTPRTLRTGKHRRGRSLPPPPRRSAAPSAAPAPPAALAPPLAEPEKEAQEKHEPLEPIAGLGKRAPGLGRLAVSLAVVGALVGSFVMVRGLVARDAQALTAPLSTATTLPPPVEKHAAPPRANDDGVSLPLSQRAQEDPAADIDVAAARAERWEVRAALEIRDLRRAIDVGNRAVRHDPSQADGWLLLAAAHFDLHDDHAANRALASCARLATHGPRGECIALLPPELPDP